MLCLGNLRKTEHGPSFSSRRFVSAPGQRQHSDLRFPAHFSTPPLSCPFFLFFVPMFAPYQPLSPVPWPGKLFLPEFLPRYLGEGGADFRFCIIHVVRARPSKLGNSRGYSCGEAARGLSSAGRVSPGLFYSISLKCHDLFLALLVVSALLALTGSHINPLLPPCL